MIIIGKTLKKYMHLFKKHYPVEMEYFENMEEKELEKFDDFSNEFLDKQLLQSVLFHYSTCAYEIMDGLQWDEEWDSWNEVCERSSCIIELGIEDYHKGIYYVKDNPANLDHLHPMTQNDVKVFRGLYQRGQDYVSQGVKGKGPDYKSIL